MKQDNLAKECGLRLRRIRMAKNMSQQEIADKLFTTPQNISKYEKDGISNIDVITKISEILGQDLLMDEKDVEGSVGEVGKEILYVLVYNGGYVDVEKLVNKHMYGMSMNRVSNEIFKLEKIGLCVREQFKDWYDQDRDVLFITAKGVITIKNSNHKNDDEKFGDSLDCVRTYEQVINGYVNYQELIEENDIERIIRHFAFGKENGAKKEDIIMTCHNVNLIQYLRLNYETGIERYCDKIEEHPIFVDDDFLPGINAYHDIIYRMSLNITNDILWKYCLCGDDWASYRFDYDYINELYNGDDVFKRETEEKLKEEMPWIEEMLAEAETDTFEILPGASKLCSILEKKIEDNPNDTFLANVYDSLLESIEFIETDFEFAVAAEDIYKKIRGENKSVYATEWFSYEEIKKFIEENFAPAKTEADIDIENKLKQIVYNKTEILDNYYEFPDEWEDNGLADLVRKNSGLFSM